ncbi:hypothetical protein [Inquilinus sp. CAU 1745]|uniref:hypothetical protein n=1 Tax=Inquilinus sp. CAU 1745 TaxID=3140369 RepID=UPI00325C0F45
MMQTTADIRAHARAGETHKAEQGLRALIEAVTKEKVVTVSVNQDRYSLNSVNGFARLETTGDVFFKFHQEEDEDGIREYYNAQILDEAGYAVDRPLFASGEPGRQILLYRRRSERRFSEICRELDHEPDPAVFEDAVAAQRSADADNARIAIETLHEASYDDIAAEPIFQLFHRRLVDHPDDEVLGGRAARFYVNGTFAFNGFSGGWSDIADLEWRINGRRYPVTLARAFAMARTLLHPRIHGPGPAVVAHGDAHNANVWFDTSAPLPRLTLFDPAFAGRHVPALLAEVKATFHNIFAHPFWLYDPDDFARRYAASVSVRPGELVVDTDWDLSPLRRRFLESKAELFWRPLLGALRAEGQLRPDWQAIMRSALFACPTLVMDLTAGGDGAHNPTSSTNGLAIAIMAASAPTGGSDPFSDFFDLLG